MSTSDLPRKGSPEMRQLMSIMGQAGGRSRSERKIAAVRENQKKATEAAARKRRGPVEVQP